MQAPELQSYHHSVSFDKSDYEKIIHPDSKLGWYGDEYIPISGSKAFDKNTLVTLVPGNTFSRNNNTLIKAGAYIKITNGSTLAIDAFGSFDQGAKSLINGNGKIAITGDESSSFIARGDTDKWLITNSKELNITAGSIWLEADSTPRIGGDDFSLIYSPGILNLKATHDLSLWANLKSPNTTGENRVIYSTGTITLSGENIVAGFKQGSVGSTFTGSPVRDSVFYLNGDSKATIGGETTEILAAINGDNGFFFQAGGREDLNQSLDFSATSKTIYIYGRDSNDSNGIYAVHQILDKIVFTTDNLIIDNVKNAIVVNDSNVNINAGQSILNGDIAVYSQALPIEEKSQLTISGNSFIQQGDIDISGNSTLNINASEVHLSGGQDSGLNSMTVNSGTLTLSAKNLYVNAISTLSGNSSDKPLTDVLKLSGSKAEAKLIADNSHFVGNITNSGISSTLDITFGSNSSLTGDLTTSSTGTSILSLGSSSRYSGTLISKGGTTTLSLGDSSTFTGTTQLEGGSLSLSLGKSAQWLSEGPSSLTQLTLTEDATISLQEIPSSTSETSSLSVEHLVGSEGVFNLAGDAETLTVSTIELGADSEAGEHFVGLQSTDSFADKEEFNIFFAHDESGNVVFKPTETLTEAGLFIQTPELTSLPNAEDGNDWFISNVSDKPGPTPESVYDNLANSYLLWRSFVDSTKERFGELREGAQSGVWGRVTAGSLSNGSLRNQYQSYRLGIDTQLDDRFSLGVMIEHHVGDIDGENGTGDMYATTGALYALFASDSGWYADGGLRFGEMKYEYTNEAMAFDKYDFKSRALGAWFESGFEIPVSGPVSITPHVGVQYGNFGSEHFTTNNGLATEIDPYSSLIWTLGADVAYKTDWMRFVASADVRTEECASVSTRIANGETVLTGDKDWSDTWIDFGVSAIVRPTDKSQLWLNFTRSAFADLEEEWRVNAGARYLFW